MSRARVGLLARVVLLLLGSLLLLAPIFVSASSPVWEPAEEISGITGNFGEVTDLSCVTDDDCVMVGYFGFSPGIAAVAEKVDGTWGPAQQNVGLASIPDWDTAMSTSATSVSCMPSGECVVVGRLGLTSGGTTGYVATRTNGSWSAVVVPGLAALSTDNGAPTPNPFGTNLRVSCDATGRCAAGGQYTYGAGNNLFGAWVAHRDTNGTWSSAIDVPGVPDLNTADNANLTRLSCPGGGNCVAIGTYRATNIQAFIVELVDGVWGQAFPVDGLLPPGGLNQGAVSFEGLDCATFNDCAASGRYGAGGPLFGGFVVNKVGGTWGSASAVPGLATANNVQLQHVSCPAVGACALTAANLTTNVAYLASQVGGTWQTAEEMTFAPGLDAVINAMRGISCSGPGECIAVGRYRTSDFSTFQAWQAVQSGGVWAEADAIPGMAALLTNPPSRSHGDAVDCVVGAGCNVGGTTFFGGAPYQFFAAARVVPSATTPSAPTALSATPGDGQLEIAFTLGDDGGAEITNLEYSLGGGTWTAFNPARTTSPVTISGLTNGIEYPIKLRAINEVGPGTESEKVIGVPTRPLSADEIIIEVEPDQVYTGAAITPNITVKDGAATLTHTDDYTVAFTDNLNAGTATVTITGVGAYSGTKTVNFTITPKPITITPNPNQSKVLGATDPILRYTRAPETLPNNDFESGSLGRVAGEAVGTYAFTLGTLDAGSNYTLSLAEDAPLFEIKPLSLSIAAPDLTRSKVYDGTVAAAVEAGALSGVQSDDAVTVTATATYDNANVGTGKTITVSYALSGAGAGNYIAPADFVVNDGVITAAPLTITGLTGANKVYDGTTAATATGTAALAGVISGDAADVSITGTPTYTFASANVATGIAITTTGFALEGAKKDNYSLSQPTLSADITPKPINDQSIIIDAIADQAYTGSAIEPAVVVKDGSTVLVLDTDYTVAYAGNTDVGAATITITGIGNYGLEREVTFNITGSGPDAPTDLTAVAGDGQVSLSWQAPAKDGGAVITGYTVTGVPSGSCQTTDLSCVITGLTNDTAYTFTVIATNSLGSSVPSASATATPAATRYALTVSSGTGSGQYVAGRQVSIAANPAASGQVFDRWTGDVAAVANVTNPNTTVTMPDSAVSVTATYKAAPEERFTLSLVNGRGAGEYLAGQTLTIAADPAPSGQRFDGWTGDVETLVNPAAENTQLIMPAANVTLTATYVERTSDRYTLTVTSGTGGGDYLAGEVITIAAEPAEEGWIFDRWTGPDSALLANANLPNTTLAMPARAVTLVATYDVAPVDPDPVALTVAFGTGGGEYLPGRTVLIAAEVREGFIFDRWVGQTAGISNVNLPNTTLLMGNEPVSITATFKEDPALAFRLSQRVRLTAPASSSPQASLMSHSAGRLFAKTQQVTAEEERTVAEDDVFAGAVLRVVAPPAPDGFVFYKWVGQTSHVDNIKQEETFIYMPDQPVDLIATYREVIEPNTLTVTGGQGSGDYLAGERVTLVADAPAAGFIFDKWVGQTAAVANVNRPETTLRMPQTDVRVSAVYRELPAEEYPLKVTGGTGSGDYVAGREVTITMPQAPPNQVFARWTGQVGTVADLFSQTTTLFMPATEVTVVAAFDPLYTVSAAVSGSGGTLSPASQQLLAGERAVITLTPSNGFAIDEVSGCGVGGELSGQTFTTAPITADCSITVSFRSLAAVVEPEVSPGGSGEIVCAVDAATQNNRCEAVPAEGWVFVGWLSCDGNIDDNRCELAAGSSPSALVARFERAALPVPVMGVGGVLLLALLMLMLMSSGQRRRMRL